MYAFAQVGVSLPHSSYAMWNYGVPVSVDQLEPGDIVFFDGLGHVGIYIGGGEYVDAPYTGVDVRIDESLPAPISSPARAASSRWKRSPRREGESRASSALHFLFEMTEPD